MRHETETSRKAGSKKVQRGSQRMMRTITSYQFVVHVELYSTMKVPPQSSGWVAWV